jgi:hypothetical protein
MTSAVAGTPPFREARLSNLEVMLPPIDLKLVLADRLPDRTSRLRRRQSPEPSSGSGLRDCYPIKLPKRNARAVSMRSLKIMNRRPGRCLIYSGNSFAEKLRHF